MRTASGEEVPGSDGVKNQSAMRFGRYRVEHALR